MAHETPVVTPSDLRDILGFTVSLARKAGALILEGSKAIHAPSAKDVGEKKNSVDLVTEYDVKVEDLVKKEIAAMYPNFKFIGEESYVAGQNELTDDPTFCVDPIDGTTNFVHGFPFVCISIGLIYHRRPALGVIYNPFLDHMYTAVRGQGAHLHTPSAPSQKLPLSSPRPLPSLSQALLAVEWGSDRTAPILDAKGGSFIKLAGDPSGSKGPAVAGGRMAHSLRSMGSAALNYAMVAQGGLDMEIGCWPWDICAGTVIAQEAGCLVSGDSHSKHDGDVAEAILTGRKYIVVRAIGDTETEKGKDAQKRLIREFYETVTEVDPL
ncbi:inositol monophosphatase [Heliocybe sulcata]|uniref:Inositol-1-monophosphatase n=1 Tax=Heliocybe sulcata TaxID=5364 RepID=A0A5C3NG50_9AGAM|nr:inositol monophosphatase [Heliocybe sulcata]